MTARTHDRRNRFGRRSGDRLRAAKTIGHYSFYDLSGKSFDCSHRQLIDGRDDCDRLTLVAGPAGAAHAMYVVFGRGGPGVIEDMRNPADIPASGGKVTFPPPTRAAAGEFAQCC